MMTIDDIQSSIHFFFDVIKADFLPEEREDQLSIALDRLALASHFAEWTFDETDYPDAPCRKYETMRELVSPIFPECGYYNVVLNITEQIGEGSPAVGDAIDDICDIAGDLEEVLWRWRRNSVDDALWYFNESYRYHWGQHLRELQLYLYAKKNGW